MPEPLFLGRGARCFIERRWRAYGCLGDANFFNPQENAAVAAAIAAGPCLLLQAAFKNYLTAFIGIA